MIGPALWLLAGAVVGLVGMFSLQWTVGRLRAQAPVAGIALTMGGMLLRLAAAGGLLWLALRRAGLVAAGAALAGLLLTRWIMIWQLNRARKKPKP